MTSASKLPADWYAVYLSHNGNLDLLSTMDDGGNWPYFGVGSQGYGGVALTKFGQKLWTAAPDRRSGQTINISSSTDGRQWTYEASVPGRTNKVPSFAPSGGILNMVFVENLAAGDHESGSIIFYQLLSSNQTQWLRTDLHIAAYECTMTAVGDKLVIFYVDPADNNIKVTWSSPTTPRSAPTFFAGMPYGIRDNVVLSACAAGETGFLTNWTRNNHEIAYQTFSFTPDNQVRGSQLFDIGLASADPPGTSVAASGRLCMLSNTNDGSKTIRFTEVFDGYSSESFYVSNQAANGTPGFLGLHYTEGTIWPKYHILSLLYAPPGSKNPDAGPNEVSYTSESTAGTTNSISNSFEESASASVTVNADEAGSLSAGWSASKTSSDSVSITKTTTESGNITVYGSTHEDGIDHQRDVFRLWLNPKITVTTDTLGNVEWTIGLDDRTTQTMLTHDVAVSVLRDPQRMSPGTRAVLAGFTIEDFNTILATNPFHLQTLQDQAPVYTGNRYVECDKTVSFSYDGGVITSVSSTVSISTSQQHAHSDESSIGYSVSASSSGIVSASVSANFTWTNTSETSQEEETDQTASYTIYPPSAEYNGRGTIYVYWDKVFRTFLFVDRQLTEL